MKKFLSIALVIVLMLSLSISFADDKTITWHSVFGLSKDATPDEIGSAIEKTFSVRPSDVDANNYYPEKKEFLGLPVRWVIKNVSDLIYSMRGLEIAFPDESLTAVNIYNAYEQLCEAFGEPSVCYITREIITLNGKEEEVLNIADLEEIQASIDQLTCDGVICWDNISLRFFSTLHTLGDDKIELKSFTFNAAFCDASLGRVSKFDPAA